MPANRKNPVTVWLSDEEREALRLIECATGLQASAILRACFRYVTEEAAISRPILRIIERRGEEHGDRKTGS